MPHSLRIPRAACCVVLACVASVAAGQSTRQQTAAAVFPVAADAREPRSVTCESQASSAYSCRIGYYFRVELVRDVGDRRCIKSRNWWLREDRIVVSGGCSGEFAVFQWGSRT